MSSRNKARRHTRAAISKVLAGMLARCDAVAADSACGMEVKYLVIFGSALDPDRADFGDLDVGIDVGVKPGREWLPILNTSYEAGYEPWNPRTGHHSPHGALQRRIKARSQIISLHDLEEVLALGCPYAVIYAAPDCPTGAQARAPKRSDSVLACSGVSRREDG